jgi:hypothetical protein
VTGATGATGPATVVTRSATGSATLATVSCLGGERAVGGGGDHTQSGSMHLSESHPTPASAGSTPTGWRVEYDPAGGGAVGTATAWVICAS